MKKKIYKICTISILFLIMPSIVNSKTYKEVTKTYNNYYFFLEEYKNGDLNLNTSYYNNTYFSPEKFNSNSDGKLTEIKLVETKDPNDNSKWTYMEFYTMLSKLSTSNNFQKIEVGGTESCLHYILGENNSTYFKHGAWSKDEGSYKGGSCNDSYAPEFSGKEYELSCASFNRDTNLEIKKINNYLYATLTRTIPNSLNVIWENLDSQKNTTNCNGLHSLDSKIYNPVLYKYTYTTTEYQCENISSSPNGSCNSYDTYTSTCDMQTINTNNASANVKVNQEITVANILTPDSVYQGEGFKFGIALTNTTSWDYVNDNIEYQGITLEEAKKEITKEMQNKIKNVTEYQNSLLLDKINFGKETLDSSLIQKTCTQTGNFGTEKKITTVCTLFLPNSLIEPYTGTIKYSNSEGINYGINNKYYTPINYTGEYKIKAILENISLFKDDWAKNWKITFDDEESCKINVNPLIYKHDKPVFNFIYRPIDITDPFPNRNAGVNWYDWYSNKNNQENLANSYQNLEYSVKLNNEALGQIKKYNANKELTGEGYFNWDFDSSGNSKFINEYNNSFITRVGDK